MKKTIALTAAFMLSFSAMSLTALAAEEDTAKDASSVSVYVNIADDKGNFPVLNKYIQVSDADEDSKITVNDVFITAHNEFFEGGAEAGYAASVGQYGLFVDKLWGIENGGYFGYCINDEFAFSLTDVVEDGDKINAFCYQDTENFSDSYSFFDIQSFESTEASDLTLTLLHKVFDEKGASKNEPLAGAVITVNGERTEAVTDEEGKVSLKINNDGEYLISAVSDTIKLIPPVCVATIGEKPAVTTTTTAEAAETTTTTAEETTTTTTEETTTTAATTTKATTTKATTTKAATTTAAKTTASNSASPKTGDAGVGASLAVVFAAVGTAFVLRKKD